MSGHTREPAKFRARQDARAGAFKCHRTVGSSPQVPSRRHSIIERHAVVYTDQTGRRTDGIIAGAAVDGMDERSGFEHVLAMPAVHVHSDNLAETTIMS